MLNTGFTSWLRDVLGKPWRSIDAPKVSCIRVECASRLDFCNVLFPLKKTQIETFAQLIVSVCVSVWLAVCRCVLEQQSRVAAASLAQYHDQLGARRRRLVLAAAAQTSAPLVYLLTCRHTHTHHNRFTALFPGPPRWAGARRELLEFMVQGKIKRGRHTEHPAGHHSIRTKQCPPASSPCFLQVGCPSCHPTVSVKALTASECINILCQKGSLAVNS